MTRKESLACLLLLAVATATQAAPVTVEKYDAIYELAADGTSTVDMYTVTRINEQSAVVSSSQRGVAYSPSRNELHIIAAYTTTKDGVRVDVDPARIVDQQHPASTAAPAHSDYKVRSVIFPQVEVGATITLHFRVNTLVPALAGVFAGGESFTRFTEFQSASLILRAPEGAPMQVFARSVKGGAVESGKPGIREWRWTHGPSAAEVREPNSVDEASISPGVMFSNVADYPALADAYSRNAAAAMKMTPAVQKLAAEITAGASDKRARAEAIYHWVSTEIRTVGVPPGFTSWTPRSTEEILADRQGESKDKSTLLVALLAAVDIRAVPALINNANRYKWQEIPLLGPFTHVITYVPEFDLYLDPMVLTPFDSLPALLRGRAVLVTGDTAMKSAVRQTPDIDAAKDRTVLRTTATLAADGAVSGTTLIETQGAVQSEMRSALASLPEQALPQLAKALLAKAGQTGDATVKPADARDFTRPYSITVTFNSPDRVNLPGPGALAGEIGAYGSEARDIVTGILRTERKLDFPCPAGGSEQLVELSLPEGMKITSLPAAADIPSSYGRYTASHEVRDGKLQITRRLDMKRPQTICTAADYAELRKFAVAVDAELRKQILYQ